MNTYWHPLIKRIQSESYRCNGKTIDAISQVTVRIALHDGCPIMWEVAGSCKVEPSSLLETLAGISHNIRQLSELCQSPEQVDDVLKKLVGSLSKNN